MPFHWSGVCLLMPSMSKDCFALFLEQFEQHRNEQHLSRPTLLIADRATTHQSKLTEHTQIVLTHLPTACPELNPVKRFFKEMRKHLANMIFASLEHAQNKVIEVFEKLTQATQKISQLTLFPYIQNAHS